MNVCLTSDMVTSTRNVHPNCCEKHNVCAACKANQSLLWRSKSWGRDNSLARSHWFTIAWLRLLWLLLSTARLECFRKKTSRTSATSTRWSYSTSRRVSLNILTKTCASWNRRSNSYHSLPTCKIETPFFMISYTASTQIRSRTTLHLWNRANASEKSTS